MNYERIDGTIFRAMIAKGFINLCNAEKEVNAINVFPVPDGDTGTNMRITLERGMGATPTAHLGNYLKELSDGMLWSARGNSGVILSQIFKGFAAQLADSGSADAAGVRDALVNAYRTAYRGVTNPVEGTILTVAREGAEHLADGTDMGVDGVFARYLSEMRKSFGRLPELLPVLKEADVMDSGAMGYLLIVEGMLGALNGETVPESEIREREIAAAESKEPSESGGSAKFGADSHFELGYCTEFLLQLLNGKELRSAFDKEAFAAALSGMGDSLIVIEQDGIVKVHIHTFTPAKVIEEAQKYGEFVAFKLENMQLQHNEFVQSRPPRKKLAVIAVAEGEGVVRMYRDCGADAVIAGGDALGVSASEFSEAYKSVNAEKIVVLPNKANNIMTAQQAIALSGASNVTVLPTKSIVEGYYALANGTSDIEDAGERIAAMQDGMDAAATVAVAYGVRDYASAEVVCKKGDLIGFVGKKPVCTGPSLAEVFADALSNVADIEERSSVFIFKGKSFSEDEEALAQAVEERLPWLSCEFVEGGQSVFELMAGVI